MDVIYTITLITNGLTLALALVLLLLVIWQDPRSTVNQIFAAFLLTVVLWSAGSLLARGALFVGADLALTSWGLRLLEAGFDGSVVMLYLFVATLTGIQSRLLYLGSLGAITIFVIYQIVLFSVRIYEPISSSRSLALRYDFAPGSDSFYLLFAVATLFMVLRYRQRIRERMLVFGVVLFVAGQLLDLFSPAMRATGIAVTVSAPAAMVMSFAIVRQRVMNPLARRASQLEAVRTVGLVVASRLNLAEVLASIARQAAELVQGDGAAIFLIREDGLELAAVHNLPTVFLGHSLTSGESVAGRVAARQRSMNLADYRRWEGEPDMPLAPETFGPTVAVPLVFVDVAVGVLEVIQGQMGRGFNEEDLRLLELLAPQAAIAIANGRLFEQQRLLTEELSIAKNQLEAVLISTESPVVAVDRRLDILLANPAARALLPDPTTEVEGRCLTDLAPPGLLPPDVRAALRDLRQGRAHIYEGGHQGRAYQCHLARLGHASAEGWVAMLSDVTQLKEVDRMKSEMVRMASHDLKNPLFGAMSYIQLLQEEGEPAFNDDLRDYVQTIDTQLDRMHRIITGILDLERVQSGTTIYETCSLSRLVREAAGELQHQAIEKGLAFSVDWPTGFFNVLGEPDQLRQAFANLIDNAIKFTPAGGRVDVRLRQDGTWIVAEVADTGIGIPQEAMPYLFERFYRVPGTEQTKGSGLGLSLVKAIVEAHGGSVGVKSTPDKGSTFWVRLPLAKAAL